MPKIQQYFAHKQVTPRGPGVRIDPASMAIVPRAAGQFAGTLESASGALGEKFLQARRVNEVSEHTLRANKEVAELDAWAAGQSDFNIIEPEYKKRIAKLSAGHRKEIKDPTVWRMFNRDFQRMSLRGEIKAGNIARSKEKTHNRASANVMLDEYADIVITSKDFETGAEAINHARAYIAGLVEAGTYDELEGQKLEQGFTEKAHINFIKREILDDPEGVLEDLKAGEYKELDEADRTDLMIKADAQATTNAKERIRVKDQTEKDLEKIREAIIEDNEYDAWQLYYNGDLSIPALEEMADKREIGEITYRNLREKLDPDTPDEDIEDNPIVVGEIAERIEMGMDVRKELRAALDKKQMSNKTYIQMSKLVAQKEYQEATSYLSNAIKPTPAEKWSPDKHLKYAEAKNRLNNLASSGVQPLVAAKEVVEAYTSDLRRTINGLRKPVHLEGKKNNPVDLEKAERLTVEAYKKGTLTDDQFKDETDLIYRLKEITGSVDNISEETRKRFEEGRK